MANDNLKEDLYSATNRLVAGYPHQGYGETAARYGEIQARTFYRTQNGNNQAALHKPIIIVDGFDPGDTRRIEDCDCEADADCASRYTGQNGIFDPELYRSIVDLMRYDENVGEDIETKNLIHVLREEGFDVIIVNMPTYTQGSSTVDGGADFIERNGKALVTLIEEVNSTLIQNNSPEELVVVGPSMGGQISRYALAYMEKYSIEHNTRLWVSFDSPHHGANIPMGDQSLVHLLSADSDAAEEQYNNLLGSIAAREQLIEFHEANGSNVNQSFLNGEVIAQALPSNSGNPHFKEHYNNQYGNGLPGSKGFPVNLRKIALVNGSLSGETVGTNEELVLDIKGVQRVCIKPGSFLGLGGGPSICRTVELTEMKSRFMPEDNTEKEIANFKKIIIGNQQVYSPNLNNRGNMDIVPGGLYTTQNEIAGAVTGTFPFATRGSFWEYPQDNIMYWFGTQSGRYRWETRTAKEYHSFIPTYSAIAHKQPNQSWFTPLNKNLVCSGETYFDSYYGEAENSEHVSLNYSMVNWLLKELREEPQEPHFPLDVSSFSWPDYICMNEVVTFSFGNECRTPGAVTQWTYPTSRFELISSTDYSLTLRAIQNGSARVVAKFQNGQEVAKNMWVGSPTLSSTMDAFISPEEAANYEFCSSNPFTVSYTSRGYASLQLTANTQNFSYLISENGITIYPTQPGYISFSLQAENPCGTSAPVLFLFTIINCSPSNEFGSYFRVYPNPASENVNIAIRDNNFIPASGSSFSAVFNDFSGNPVSNVSIVNNIGTINVSALLEGYYVLTISVAGKPESHLIYVDK